MRLSLLGCAPPGKGMRGDEPCEPPRRRSDTARDFASGVRTFASRDVCAALVSLRTSAMVLPESRSSTEIWLLRSSTASAEVCAYMSSAAP